MPKSARPSARRPIATGERVGTFAGTGAGPSATVKGPMPSAEEITVTRALVNLVYGGRKNLKTLSIGGRHIQSEAVASLTKAKA